LSFFSKQIPGAYLAFLTIITIIFYFLLVKKEKNYNFLFFVLGGMVGITLFFIIFVINKIPIQNFLIQYIYYPITIGENRSSDIIFNFKVLFLQFKFIYFSILPILIASFFLLKKKKRI
jgi:multisubunit Na+/H+ antiporter MnhB subunit